MLKAVFATLGAALIAPSTANSPKELKIPSPL